MASSDDAAKLRLKVLTDAATASSVAMAKVGKQLGFYKAMAELGQFDAAQLAEHTGTIQRYVYDWLVNQAGAGYVSYDAQKGKFYLTAAQTEVFTNESSPNFGAMLFTVISGMIEGALRDLPTEMRLGKGVPFGSHDPVYIGAIADFTFPSYRDQLVQNWLPACMPETLLKRLRDGDDTPLVIADVGCGYGMAIRLMSQAYSKQHLFIGFDGDGPSIEVCKQKTADEKLDNCLFVECDAHYLPAPGDVDKFEQLWRQRCDKPAKTLYDIVMSMNVLHDLPDPLAALVAIRNGLNSQHGVCLVIEPNVKEPLEANFNPMGQLQSIGSATWCTPNGMCARADGKPKTSVNLGSLAADSCYEELAKQAGFSKCVKSAMGIQRMFVLFA